MGLAVEREADLRIFPRRGLSNGAGRQVAPRVLSKSLHANQAWLRLALRILGTVHRLLRLLADDARSEFLARLRHEKKSER